MRIALVFDKHRPDTTGIYFEQACRQLGLEADHWWLRDVRSIPPVYDGYLRIDHGDDYLTPWPEALRPAVFYAIDTHLPHSWKKIRRAASRYDLVCCAQREAAERLRAEWLPLACAPAPAGTRGSAPAWDVAFVGNDGGTPRKFYLQALRERYPNSFLGRAAHTELPALYARARIGFNYSIANDVNMRIFEVLAARAVLVTNALQGDALSRLGFEDRRHLVLYRSGRELFDRIDELLVSPETCEALAAAGHALVRQRHTYAHRVAQLLGGMAKRFGLAVDLPDLPTAFPAPDDVFEGAPA